VEQRAPHEPARTGFAFCVHVLTASGAAWSLLALIAAIGADWSRMFLWLGLALFVDGIDGTFARRLKVADVLPRWSGDTIDLVVDFVSYVFIPAYAIVAGGLLPPLIAFPAGFVILVTSALYFGDRRMKTKDHYFRGFPAVWNIAAFYLFLLRPEPWLCAVAIAALAALTFVPYPFLHPLRVTRLRIVNIVMVLLGTVLALVAVTRDMMPGPWITGLLAAIGVWFLAGGLWRPPVPPVEMKIP